MSGYPIVEQTVFGGEDVLADVQKVEVRGKYASVSTATTTLVKVGPGVVNSIRAVGGTMGAVTIYDNTAASGTVILPAVTPAQSHVLLEDVAFATGLTIVTAAATILAISYR